jgi:hypothetical protein
MKHLFIFLLTLFASGIPLLKAQEVISASGAQASGTGVALSWTIGEPVIETATSGSYMLTQGFHQSRLSATAVDDILTPGLSLAVYPNPFSYVLHVKVDDGDFSQLQYSLFSIDGKILLNNKLTGNLTQIELQTFASGNYLLQINRKSGERVKTFKVIKN